jgi:glycerophosphoryl diester phosphodiesterase
MSDMLETLLAEGGPERELAARHAPIIQFDDHEPFLPLAVGYTVFRAAGPSLSFPRQISMHPVGAPPAAYAIEYAIWWDWDIQHLYELEHVWAYSDAAGRLIHSEASAHGGFRVMRHAGQVPREGERALVYAEPGKHAFAPDPSHFSEPAHPRAVTEALAGLGGLLVKDMFADEIRTTPQIDTLARSYLSRHAFAPSLRFTQRVPIEAAQLVPWPALRAWIPRRIAWWVERLAAEIPPEQYRPLRIGHRGAAAHAADNTLAGIAAAARLGADAVEIDLRRSRDGVAVASHESHLPDAAGQLRPVGGMSAAELAAVGVPTLAEVLASCRERRVGLYVELKEGAAIGPMLADLAAAEGAEFTVVGSFRPDWLADLRAQAPELATSVLFSSPEIDPVALAQACGARYVHPCWERQGERPDELLTPDWVARVRAAELGLICWHEERPEVIAGLRRRGVDGICSDRPELLA